MSDSPLTPTDLSIYLGVDFGDDGKIEARAAMILGMAAAKCLAEVNPLPDGANAVILDVAARAFNNPSSATGQQAVGPFSANTGTLSGGLWLTSENKATLRQLAGRTGGAFTIDLLPATAGTGLPWWDTGSTVGWGDFDVAP